MFRLETFRLIRKTIRRFLSLTVIVFIGAGFMMGLLSAPTVMRESVDRYYDEYNLQDLMIYSPYGFCKEDYLKFFPHLFRLCHDSLFLLKQRLFLLLWSEKS